MRKLVLLVVVGVAAYFAYTKYGANFDVHKFTNLLSVSGTASPAPEASQSSGSTTPAPGNNPQYATAGDAQRAAVKRYPALGIAGSTFNTEFLALYNRYKKERPEYFSNAQWPVSLADEVAHKLAPGSVNAAAGQAAQPLAAMTPAFVTHHFTSALMGAKMAAPMELDATKAFTLSQLEEAKAKAQRERKPLGFVMTWGQFFGQKSNTRDSGSNAAFVHFYQVFHNNLVLVFVRHETELQSVPDAVKKGFFSPDEGGFAPNMAVTDATATEFIVEIPMGGGGSDGRKRDEVFKAGADKIDQWWAVHPAAVALGQ